MKRVLVMGGTGYLGQHLLMPFVAAYSNQHGLFAFTYHSSQPAPALLNAIPKALPFYVDLRTGHGLEAVSASFGQPDVVINCAPISVPRVCEMDPEAAMLINAPISLMIWVSSFRGTNTLLIHLSTDQVYEGTKSYKEEDETIPVNTYGKSKVEAEHYITANWSNYAILRSSIIYGPQTIFPVPKQLPIQWIDNVRAKGEPLDFFHDEYRCPVFVNNVVLVIQSLANKWLSEGEQIQLLLNVGGPDRVSRVQMAEAIADP